MAVVNFDSDLIFFYKRRYSLLLNRQSNIHKLNQFFSLSHIVELYEHNLFLLFKRKINNTRGSFLILRFLSS